VNLVLDVADAVAVEIAPRRVPVTFPHGRCSVAVTTNPFGLPANLNMHTYAVLASWLTDEPVGMWITFTNQRGKDDPVRLRREVHAVFATPSLRGIHTAGEPTIPVAIGQWLFQSDGLTHHSPDRTNAGDRWARAVGGDIPERDQKGTAEEAEQQGPLVLALLNRAGLRPA
jgi:hypothetical protein